MYFHILTGINIDVQGLAYNELYPCKGSVLTILIRRKGREYLERSALFTGHGNLFIKKVEENLYFNLRSEGAIEQNDSSLPDRLEGVMEFKGKIVT
jgi:hypothetical protein